MMENFDEKSGAMRHKRCFISKLPDVPLLPAAIDIYNQFWKPYRTEKIPT
jgi:hypothetical protein